MSTSFPTRAPGEFMAVDVAADTPYFFVSGAAVGPSGMPELRQIRTWDLGDPRDPVELPRIDIADLGGTVRMVAAEGRLYLAANDVRPTAGGYQSPAIGAADVSEPNSMSWLGFWQRQVLGGVELVSASDRDVVIKEYAGLTHLFESPYETGQGRAGYLEAGAAPGIAEMQLEGDRLHTVGLRKLSLFDLSDRSSPVRLSQVTVDTRLPVLAASRPYVFATKCKQYDPEFEEEGCAITAFEVTADKPPTMRHLSTVPVGRLVRSIALSDLVAYVVSAVDVGFRPEKLSLYDFKDPARPSYVADLDLGDGAKPKSVVIRDGLAYVSVFTDAPRNGSASTGLRVVDVSNPKRSHVIGAFDTPTTATDRDFGFNEQNYPVAVLDGYALFAGNEAVVHVVDVHEPEHPVEVQRVEVKDTVTDLAAAARHAYVAMKDGGMITLRATYPEPEPTPGRVAYIPLVVTDGAAHNPRPAWIAQDLMCPGKALWGGG